MTKWRSNGSKLKVINTNLDSPFFTITDIFPCDVKCVRCRYVSFKLSQSKHPRSVACPLRSRDERPLVFVTFFRGSRRTSCQLLVKELALNSGKLPSGGLPRNMAAKAPSNSLLTVPRRKFSCGSRLPFCGVRVSLTLHLKCVHIILVPFGLLSDHLLGNSCSLDFHCKRFSHFSNRNNRVLHVDDGVTS